MGEVGTERREPLAEQALLVLEVPESRSPSRATGLEEGALRTHRCVRVLGTRRQSCGEVRGK